MTPPSQRTGAAGCASTTQPRLACCPTPWESALIPLLRPSHLLAFALAALLLAALLLAPSSAAADGLRRDDRLHFGVSLGLGAGAYALSVPLVEPPWARATIGATFALLVGVAKELRDLAGYGDPEWRDLGFDVLGTATGVLFAWALDRLVQHLRSPESPTPMEASP